MHPEPANAETRRQRRTAVGLSALLVLGLLVVGAWWSAATGEPRSSSPDVDALAAPASPGPTSFAEREQAVEPEAPVAAVAGADDEIELCGGHWVQAGPDGKPSVSAALAVSQAEFETVAAAVLARMAASASPRAQAAAHYYLATGVGALSPAAPDRSADAAVHRDALARLAQTTDDAQVYAWAHRYCNLVDRGAQGACTQVTAANWARLDPENAEPWLAVAEEARARNDPAALDDAMFHVAAAGRHQSSRTALAATVAEYAPQDERSLVGTYLTIAQALVIESVDEPAWKGAAEYCGAQAIADPNRRETCERVATVLVDRSTSVPARSAGLGIGRRLDWSAGRLDAVAEREDAEAAAARLGGAEHDPDLTDCAPLRATIERVRVMAEFGQLEMLRRQASVYPAAQLAAETRRRREREARQLAAEPAASAAGMAQALRDETVAQR